MGSEMCIRDRWEAVAKYAQLTHDLHKDVEKSRQAAVRGLVEQRDAEFKLRVAQQDRLVAEAEGALAVAKARLALDAEIRKGAIAAQLKLRGLQEDWDTYQSWQAIEAQGTLKVWSDAAVRAFFEYEASRAQAMRAELQARLEMVNAEAALAAAQRQNARNQQDLLVAQERLIRMSAKVAGVDLVEATGGATRWARMVRMRISTVASWLTAIICSALWMLCSRSRVSRSAMWIWPGFSE